MTSRDFVIWLKGFTEACNDYAPTPKQWDRIKEVLENVEDYDDNPGIDVEIDDFNAWCNDSKNAIPISGSSTHTYSWNDEMVCYQATNYPKGSGYYTNSTADIKKEKQQLND